MINSSSLDPHQHPSSRPVIVIFVGGDADINVIIT